MTSEPSRCEITTNRKGCILIHVNNVYGMERSRQHGHRHLYTFDWNSRASAQVEVWQATVPHRRDLVMRPLATVSKAKDYLFSIANTRSNYQSCLHQDSQRACSARISSPVPLVQPFALPCTLLSNYHAKLRSPMKICCEPASRSERMTKPDGFLGITSRLFNLHANRDASA